MEHVIKEKLERANFLKVDPFWAFVSAFLLMQVFSFYLMHAFYRALSPSMFGFDISGFISIFWIGVFLMAQASVWALLSMSLSAGGMKITSPLKNRRELLRFVCALVFGVGLVWLLINGFPYNSFRPGVMESVLFYAFSWVSSFLLMKYLQGYKGNKYVEANMINFKRASDVLTIMVVIFMFVGGGLLFDSLGYNEYVRMFKVDSCVTMPLLSHGNAPSAYTTCPPSVGFGLFTTMGLGVFVLVLTRLLIGVDREELDRFKKSAEKSNITGL